MDFLLIRIFRRPKLIIISEILLYFEVICKPLFRIVDSEPIFRDSWKLLRKLRLQETGLKIK